MNPSRLTAPWVCRRAPGTRRKRHSEMLIASEKLCLPPPWPGQGFAFWLRRNSLPRTQSNSHKSQTLPDCASSLCQCQGAAVLPGRWPFQASFQPAMPRDTPHHQPRRSFTAALRCSADSELCHACMSSPRLGFFVSRSIFYKIKHLNNVCAARLFSQGCSRWFLCCCVSLEDFCQTAIRGCGVTES